MSKHTAEPWHVETGKTADGDTIHSVVDSAGETVWQGYDSPQNRERAARIVACVNACAGIDSDALAELPDGTVAGLLKLATSGVQRVIELKQQRDELLASMQTVHEAACAALKVIHPAANESVFRVFVTLRVHAETAIAKVQS